MKTAKIKEKYRFATKPTGLKLSDYDRIAFIPMELVPTNRLFLSDYILKSPDAITSGIYFEDGDLLISKITPCFENGKQGIAKNIPNGFGIASTEIIPIKAIPNESDLAYLYYCLLDSEIRHALAERMEGATGRQRLSKSVLQDWVIPFPSLSEQKAIASVLAKIQAAIELQDRTISTLKELKAATMEKLFREGLKNDPLKATSIGKIPESWEIVRFSDTCEPPQYGYTETASLAPIGPKFLRITDIQESIVNWETVPYCNCETQKFPKYLLRSGDLVFARIGATAGKSYLVSDPPEAVFASYLIRLRPIKVHPVFLYFFCQSDLYWQQVNAIKGENLKGGFSGSILKNFFHCLPKDIQEQEKIGEMLSTIQNKILFHNKKIASLKRLFSSILPKLLTGELRVNEILEFLEKAISNV